MSGTAQHTITLPRTEFIEQAKTKADSARTLFLLVVGFAALLPIAAVVMHFTVPRDVFFFFLAFQITMTLICMGVAGFFWHRAHKNLPNYASRVQAAWNLECRDIEHAWDVEGLGSCEGWRDVAIECVRLPKRQGKMLAIPSLKVMVDNERRSLLSRELRDSDNNRSVSFTDKDNRPLRILISHTKPEEASDELPWEVKISVRGDPNPPETLVANPVDTGKPDAGDG